MIIRTVSPDEYYGAFPVSRCVYGSRGFIDVTPGTVEAVRHFVGFDEEFKPRFGLVAGYKAGEWHAPYSAPFAEIAYGRPQQLERIYDFISELAATLGAPLHLTLAPDFYDPAMLPKIKGVASNYASKVVVDFNYHYPCSEIGTYTERLDHSARKNFRRALQTGFTFALTDDVARCYEVIRLNRESRGYPLAMTLEQVRRTVAVVKADMMVMSLGEADVAAALVYHVADGIVQVIYWGDAPGYSASRPMNVFSYLVFKHYAERGVRIVDVGPSSKAGIPNSGLCRFKESIGCRVTLKPTFVIKP